MELTISELDTTMNPYNINEHFNYWDTNENENQKEEKKDKEKEKRKKVSFKDIMSNINLVVNSQGVLQRIVPKREQESSPELLNNTYYPQQYNQYNQYHQYDQSTFNEEPIVQSVKHSYIYNKYFKDYVDLNTPQSNVRVPKTMEEYRQM